MAIARSCQSTTVAKLGERCGGLATACEGGSYCNGTTCARQPREGDDCALTRGPDCLAPSMCENGKCIVPDGNTCK
ncbi:hypothetical protein [Pendulispora albinea]|uniref:Disintegrin domain-containing protein n=1 Tax=Pendulispora albinea TaxID=2741071 RepID=A0ABZ2LVI0_9BACT